MEIPQRQNLRICLRHLFYLHSSDEAISIFQSNGTLQAKDFRRILYTELTSHSYEYGYTYDQCNIITDWFVSNFKEDVFRAIALMGNNLTNDETPTVKLDGILRWHDTSIYLTEDLMTCAHLAYNSSLENPVLDWNPFLHTDSRELDDVLKRPLSDIHAHLKGSSLNFDVNWICLMNHITHRQESFRTIESSEQSYRQSRTLYEKAVIASAIRLYLSGQARKMNLISKEKVRSIINASNPLASLTHALELQDMIDTTRELNLMNMSSNTVKTAKIDYALFDGIIHSGSEKCPYSTLAGERFVIYSTLKSIRDGGQQKSLLSSWLYLYLVIKNEVRHQLVQLNDAVGFENFNQYEHRKTAFIEDYPLYEELLVKLSVSSFFAERADGSTHETRIAPKADYDKCLQSLKDTDANINTSLLGSKVPSDSYGYDYHFIKKSDKTSEYLLPLYERHHDLRESVKQEALNICRIRNGYEVANGKYLAERIVGIDAANSEILCRPEVFAQAFRFLRNHQIEHPEINNASSLGITYHVGEDFVDVVDGLRAVDELLHYMNYRKGDRLGHALVLGVDVPEYYSKRRYSICMSRQMFLDNVVWLYHMLTVYGGYKRIAKLLLNIYEKQFEAIHQGTGISRPPISTYYDSWLLRGDNPGAYQPDGTILPNHLGDWNEQALNEGLESVRMNKTCCRLYYMYHYSASVKQSGNDMLNLQDEIDDCSAMQLIRAIRFVQQIMLKRVQRMGIAIECNPTSNFKIGEIDRYDEHPIQKFYPYLKDKKLGRISASINTDDKGIFATSIEREYALIYAAFKRKVESDIFRRSRSHDISRWMDEIRTCSNEQSFVKYRNRKP